MDSITNKAIVISVGIFVTIAITSGILLSLDRIKEVYKQVYETDTSIKSKFTEFDAYDNTEKTGLELINTINKYANSQNVKVIWDGKYSEHQNENGWLGDIDNRVNDLYKTIYFSSVSESNGIITISFDNVKKGKE